MYSGSDVQLNRALRPEDSRHGTAGKHHGPFGLNIVSIPTSAFPRNARLAGAVAYPAVPLPYGSGKSGETVAR